MYHSQGLRQLVARPARLLQRSLAFLLLLVLASPSKRIIRNGDAQRAVNASRTQVTAFAHFRYALRLLGAV